MTLGTLSRSSPPPPPPHHAHPINTTMITAITHNNNNITRSCPYRRRPSHGFTASTVLPCLAYRVAVPSLTSSTHHYQQLDLPLFSPATQQYWRLYFPRFSVFSLFVSSSTTSMRLPVSHGIPYQRDNIMCPVGNMNIICRKA